MIRPHRAASLLQFSYIYIRNFITHIVDIEGCRRARACVYNGKHKRDLPTLTLASFNTIYTGRKSFGRYTTLASLMRGRLMCEECVRRATACLPACRDQRCDRLLLWAFDVPRCATCDEHFSIMLDNGKKYIVGCG